MAVAGETAAIQRRRLCMVANWLSLSTYILSRTARLDSNSRKKQDPYRKIFWHNLRVRPLDDTCLFRLK